MDKAVKLLAISIFRNLHVITKITKILYYENLEPYGIRTRPRVLRALGRRAYISGKALLPVL